LLGNETRGGEKGGLKSEEGDGKEGKAAQSVGEGKRSGCPAESYVSVISDQARGRKGSLVSQ